MSIFLLTIIKYSPLIFVIVSGIWFRKDLQSLFRVGSQVASRKSLASQTFRSDLISAYLAHLRDNYGPARPAFPMDEVTGMRDNSIDNARRILAVVARYMGIKCQIDLQASAEDVKADKDRAHAVAWVYAKGVPHYNSSAFEQYTVRMYIQDRQFSGQYMDINWMVHVLAHECAHIILYSSADPFRDSEMMTDMLAIHYGFDEAYLQVNKFDLSNPKAIMRSIAEEEWNRQIDGASEYSSRLENLFVVLAVREEKYLKPFRVVSDFLRKR